MSGYKPKSDVLVNETELPADDGSCIRKYTITSATFWKRQFKIKQQPSQKHIYTISFCSSFSGDWTLLVNTGSLKDANTTIAAAAKVSLMRDTTLLSLGDPAPSAPQKSQRIEMVLNSAWKHNNYAVSLPTWGPSQQVATAVLLQWKGTNTVTGTMKKMDRGMHHKLVEAESNRLLARYVHDPWSMDVDGAVEICSEGPEGWGEGTWDLFVLVSAVAVAEKNIKLLKMMM